MASISIRQSIAWLPAPHSEPTSTVVLTSPGRWYVDVRILLSKDGAFLGDSELEWALAGTSESTAVTSGVSDCVWRHWVDSRHEDADTQVDRGRNTDQADGSVLETGAMVNPATGHIQNYEEVWQDTDVPADSRCVVLQHEAGPDRGLTIVLGGYCQGILRAKDGVTVERWEQTTDRSWKRVYRSGAGQLPCGQLVSDLALGKKGTTLVCDNLTWTVVETAQE
ncbi:hypothetical protein SEUCBS140593_007860 [Sporothrix eucalyptigena]|uniref:Protein HRI1 n=1 Tax=Sporothrix eucalyptigena TaxID=1812306 RepID=A0ABP0CI22_9PEZI